ncbi:MAG: hypothetical protein Q4A44_04680 [Bacteroidales bacterium]|nr:hypothetical protein [Bacteroidales bacterium]
MNGDVTHVNEQWRVLTSWQLALYRFGGVMMLVGAFAYAVNALRTWSWLLYGIGVLAYTSMQIYANYRGNNLIVRRLRRQQVLSCALLVFSALALVASHFELWFLRFGNTWLLLLIIATVFQVYTAFRIPMAMK